LGFCSLGGLDPLWNVPGIRMLKMLQLQRVSWMQPALWALVFAVALALICKTFRGGRLLAWGLVAIQLFVVISAEQREHQESRLTFTEFFSPGLFRDIRDFIGKPQGNYRVASLGLYPS